jgi:hypothetical protein
MLDGAPWRILAAVVRLDAEHLRALLPRFLRTANGAKHHARVCAHEAKDEATLQTCPGELDVKIPLALLPKVELPHDLPVPFEAARFQVIEQSPTFANQLEQTSARVMVFDVCFEMLGELADALGNDGNLHLGRASILFVRSVFLNKFSFFIAENHEKSSPFGRRPTKRSAR